MKQTKEYSDFNYLISEYIEYKFLPILEQVITANSNDGTYIENLILATYESSRIDREKFQEYEFDKIDKKNAVFYKAINDISNGEIAATGQIIIKNYKINHENITFKAIDAKTFRDKRFFDGREEEFNKYIATQFSKQLQQALITKYPNVIGLFLKEENTEKLLNPEKEFLVKEENNKIQKSKSDSNRKYL